MAFEVDSMGICVIEQENFPAVGFGTYPMRGEICSKVVGQAIETGYRIIDTATFYDNLAAIGKVLKKSERSRFYIISKVWHDALTSNLLKNDLKRTLQQLQTDYLDAYLVHWPNSQVPIEETLCTMEELRRQGLIRHIGLSNVTVNHLKRALEINVPISWVQIEMNPRFYDAELLAFCEEHSISVQAWAPLGRGRLNEDVLLLRIGEKYGKSASQIAIKWILQHGCIPLTGTKNIEHMQQNLEMNDFVLSQQEIDEIDQRAQSGKRERLTEGLGIGFSDEFDFAYEECWPKKSSVHR